jgi:hypothetical protein
MIRGAAGRLSARGEENMGNGENNLSGTGPLLSDREFFGSCLPGTAEMEPVRAAAERGDYPGARRAFGRLIRENLRPDLFFRVPYEVPENFYKWPEENDLEAAGRICRNELISCGTLHAFGGEVDWFANPTFNGYKEWTWQLSRHNEWKHLAKVYRDTGDEKYARAAASLFESWVKQALVPPEDTEGGDTLCWRTIECGIRMGANWPYVLHSFYKSPAFTDDIIVDWYKSVREHGRRLRLRHRQGNWLIMEMNGLAQIGILYPELAEAEAWYDYAVKKLGEELDRQIYPDGFQYELSTNYHFVVINNYHRLMLVMEAYGKKAPALYAEKLERAAELYVKIMRPDGRVPDINDGNDHYAASFLGTLGDLFPENKVFRWVVSGGKEGREPDYRSIALPYSGFMIMRSGWGKDQLWALFDGAPFGTGHQHEDKLNLLVYAGGKAVLTEGGNYAYDSSEMRRYVLSTRSHNTMRLDGEDQNRRLNYRWREEDISAHSGLKYRIEEDFDYAEAEYNEGYGPGADRSVSHRRGILFLKKVPAGLCPFFVVIDRFFSGEDKGHFYEILWHLNEDPVELRGNRVSCGEFGILCSGGPGGIALVKGQEYPEWQGWIPGGSGKQGDYKPIHTLIRGLGGGNLRALTLLYPQGVPPETIEGGSAPEDTEIRIRYRGGELVLDERAYR